MESPKYPFDRDRSSVSQAFGADHDGWDIIPHYRRGDGLPADVYPVFSGRAVGIQDASTSKGKGIKVRTDIWPDLAAHLAGNGVPNARRLECLYWHLLSVTDKDGLVSQGTSVGICGNTGNVWSNGQKVPDSEKGVPPYRGLHLHLETYVDGRPVDPQVIFNYKPKDMETTYELVRVEGTDEFGILETTRYTKVLHRCIDLEDLAFAGRKFGVETSDLNKAKIIKL